MNKKLEEYKFDHFKNIDEVMHYFNYWYKEEQERQNPWKATKAQE